MLLLTVGALQGYDEKSSPKVAYQGLCRECANREMCRKRKPNEVIISCAAHNPGPPISAKSFNTFEQALDFAIKGEEKTYGFYRDLMNIVKEPSTKKAFKSCAKMSQKHRKRLIKIKKKGHVDDIKPENVQTLKITSYVTKPVKISDSLHTREVLLMAINNTCATQRLYSDLSIKVENSNIQKVFMILAQEQAKEKLKLETEYDDFVLREN